MTQEPQPISWGGRLSQLAAQEPEREALRFVPTEGEDLSCSWAQLERRSRQVARLLAASGVGQGSLVIVGLPNCLEHFFATFAAWKLGACVVPLRWDLPAWERNRMLEVADPKLVVCEWTDTPVVSIGPDDLARSQSLSADPLPDRTPDPGRGIASSGSTGRPKIIVELGPGQAVPTETRQVWENFVGIEPGERTELIPAPLYHTNGFKLAHSALFAGARVVLMQRFDAAKVVELIERYRIQTVTMASPMLMRIARLPDVRERDLSSLQMVLQGAAALPEWVARTWIELVGPERFFMSYGSTENVGMAMIRGDEYLEHPGSVGKGADTEIRIFDPDTHQELPPGEVGEIFMRYTTDDRPSFAYVGADTPPSTPEGLTSIGDLGRLDEDGYLYVADRRVDMIVSGAANVFPAEVEAAILEHPEVVDAAVIGLPDSEWGQRVHAVVQPRDPEAHPSSDELEAHCRERLAAYKVPKAIEWVERLPRSDAGKLNRSSLVSARSGD